MARRALALHSAKRHAHDPLLARVNRLGTGKKLSHGGASCVRSRSHHRVERCAAGDCVDFNEADPGFVHVEVVTEKTPKRSLGIVLGNGGSSSQDAPPVRGCCRTKEARRYA